MRIRTAAVPVLALLALAPAPAQGAERLYGVTTSNRLVRFQSDSPAAIRSSRPITGLAEDNEHVLGIDVRPATGALYAIADTSRLYRLDPRTGKATEVGSEPITPGLRADKIGFDFDPLADRIRVVTRDGQDLRVNPDTLETVVDRDLSFTGNGQGSPALRDPGVVAEAYRGATLYALDTATSALFTQAPQNAGTLNRIGPLGLDIDNRAGFDIAADGVGWATLIKVGDSTAALYRVDLSRGTATPATSRSTIPTRASGDDDPVESLATAGRVADDRRRPRISTKATRRISRRDLLLRRNLTVAVRCNEACRLTVQLLAGRRVVGSAKRDIRGSAGRTVLRAKAGAAGRRRIKRAGARSLRYRVVAVDEAGNKTVSPKRTR